MSKAVGKQFWLEFYDTLFICIIQFNCQNFIRVFRIKWNTLNVLMVRTKIQHLIGHLNWVILLAFPCVVLLFFFLFYKGIYFIHWQVWVSLSVSDDQARDILLQPEIKQLEDWEIILQNHLGNLELEALPNDSQVSWSLIKVDYFASCLMSKPTSLHFYWQL